MPQFNSYSDKGITLMVEYKCHRCGKAQVDHLEPHVPKDGYGYLHNLSVPEGWSNHFYGVLLCPECTEKLRWFLEGSETR